VSVPADLKYAETHEWHKADGLLVTIGITQFAADALTDITYVDLPTVGSAVTAGENFGEIESVKATSDLVSGVTGIVAEVNAALEDDPALVNNEPFEGGWMIKVETTDPSDIDELLTAEEYEAFIAE
jgi:glycine cleavage system H protein